MNMHSKITAAKNTNSQIEYQLRSMSGRPVISFTDLHRATEESQKRKLRLFVVTTISKEITYDAAQHSH